MKKVNLKVILDYIICFIKQKKTSDITIIVVKNDNNSNMNVTLHK